MRLLLLMLLAMISSPKAVSAEVKIATDPWCPYVCHETDKTSGIMVDIVEQAFAEAGYLVEFVSLNWARAIAEARKGGVQGIIGGFKSDSPDFVFGSEHLLYSQMCFYTEQQDNWQYKGVTSLGDRSSVIVNSYSYGVELDDYISANQSAGEKNVTKVYGKDTIAQRLKLMAKRKINTLIEDKVVMTQVNEGLESHRRLRNAGCLAPEKVYLAFSPNSNLSPRLSRAFDKGIRKLRESGKLAQIINGYQ